jgi:NADH dehydrogenase/NADH:ubiquinone oxidoreductase subunit G
MFKRVFPLDTNTVTVSVEGKSVSVPEGDSVAAAVFSAGFDHTRRSPISASPRAPYCMMGVCFECLVEIDGVPNQQACMTPVKEGMRIKLQAGAGSIVS